VTVGPEQPGLSEPIGYFFYERSGRKLRPFNLLTGREQRRQIRGYQRLNPGATDREAQRAIASQRRKGFLARTGPAATPEQAEQTSGYLRRQEISRRSAETRQRLRTSGVAVVTYQSDDQGNTATVEVVVSPASNLSRADRGAAARHRNIVHVYLRHADNPANVEKLLAYEGLGVTDRSTGAFIPFEYDPNRLDAWALFDEAGTMFNPQDYYREMSPV
jgi:hypothetical protein